MIKSYNLAFHVQAFKIRNVSENSTRKIYATAKQHIKKKSPKAHVFIKRNYLFRGTTNLSHFSPSF